MTGKCSDIRYGFGYNYTCNNNAKVERDGKGYCLVHDPVRKKLREQARSARWDAEQKERRHNEDVHRNAQERVRQGVKNALEQAERLRRLGPSIMTSQFDRLVGTLKLVEGSLENAGIRNGE